MFDEANMNVLRGASTALPTTDRRFIASRVPCRGMMQSSAGATMRSYLSTCIELVHFYMPSQLNHLRIGNVDIGFPVVLGALSGYSDMAMRVIARRLGASYSICEVVLDRLVLEAGKKTRRRFMQVSPEEHPV